MKDLHVHTSHKAIVARLRRAGGHLQATVTMIEQGRRCLEIAQQLQAVEQAVRNARKALIQDHLDHCMADLAQPMTPAQQEAMAEVREITRGL